MNRFANFAYLVGDLSAVGGVEAAGKKARKTAPEPESVAAPAAAAKPREGQNQAATAGEGAMLGRGYRIPGLEELQIDLKTTLSRSRNQPPLPAPGPRVRRNRHEDQRPAGRRPTTLADHAFGSGPRMPIIRAPGAPTRERATVNRSRPRSG